MMKKAKELGVDLRRGGERTAKLSREFSDSMGLLSLQRELTKMMGREVDFMIYESEKAIAKRGIYAPIPK